MPTRCLACLLVAASLLAAAAPAARAQIVPPLVAPDYNYGLTRGIYIPGRVLTGDADATAVEMNPAQLALLNDWSLMLVGDAWSQSTALPGRGAALFYGSPLILNSYWGIGIEGVGSSDVPPIAGHTKVQLALAFRLGRSFGFGIDWGHLLGSPYGSADTFDVGASWRLLPYASIAFVLQDFTQPRVLPATLPSVFPPNLPRVWSGELALRPFGTNRLEIAAAAVHVEGDAWNRIVPRLRGIGRIVDGLRLFGEVETLPSAATGDLAFGGKADYRATVGLWFDFDHAGAAGAARMGFPGAGDNAFGASFALRVSGDSYPSLIEFRHTERVTLAGLGHDREYVRLVTRLRALAVDDSVAAVVFKVKDVDLGLGRIEELRELIGRLRRNGKRVIAYVISPTTREYYLAAASDLIVVHPAGEVTLNGFAQEVTFYKKVMDTLGVRVDLVRIAEFKGAMEPFVMNESSAPVRWNKDQILDDVYDRLVNSVALDRRRSAGGAVAAGLTPEKVRELIQRGLFTPQEAQAAGLVDAVKDDREMTIYMAQLLGRAGADVREPDPSPVHPAAWGRRRVAVVMVDGTIVDSASQQLPFDLGSFAGADTLVAALEECRLDPGIAAVVLRVNSPGGSAFASDVIAREIVQLRGAGKPVVVSMGDYAASGGYYISAPADVILAEPSTITGSIGIFAFKVDVEKLLETVGVSVETFRRGAHAGYLSPYRPWTDEEVQMVAQKIRHFYDMFLATVVEGRKARGITTIARADELGRGRVWTGSQAAGVGLVDQRGGVGDAIDIAARLARVGVAEGDLPELQMLPRTPSALLQRLLGLDGAEREVARLDDGARGASASGAREAPPMAPAELGARMLAAPGARAAWRLLAPLIFGQGGAGAGDGGAGVGSGVQARMPFDLEIR
jgi:protease-4